MVDQTILNAIDDYLKLVTEAGIQVKQAVLFGSWARGEAEPEGDIDLIVIAPEFDGQKNRQLRFMRCRSAGYLAGKV
ncbi:MAG: nucleotidyltransferase domain-containing protein [Anaerolineae bacterium]